jgi:hypothetical protein
MDDVNKLDGSTSKFSDFGDSGSSVEWTEESSDEDLDYFAATEDPTFPRWSPVRRNQARISWQNHRKIDKNGSLSFRCISTCIASRSNI